MGVLAVDKFKGIVAALRKRGVVYARLFGSAARGALTPDSDVDIAVVGPRPLTTADTFDLIADVSTVVARPVDIVDLRSAHGAIAAEAWNGIELFCDDELARADALYRRITVVQDDLEFARAAFESAREHLFQR